MIQFLICQVLAPWMFLDFPKFHSLNIISIKKYPKEFTTHYYDHLLLHEPQELPERLVIKGRSSKGESFYLGLNLEDDTVAIADWSDLTGKSWHGSGDIGIVFIGIPGIILSLPLTLPVHLLYSIVKRITKMDRHDWFIYLKLKPQLNKSNAKHLKRALQNHTFKSDTQELFES